MDKKLDTLMRLQSDILIKLMEIGVNSVVALDVAADIIDEFATCDAVAPEVKAAYQSIQSD